LRLTAGARIKAAEAPGNKAGKPAAARKPD
jgi:hypothetical protein